MILIIDNKSKVLDKLVELAAPIGEVKVIAYYEIPNLNTDNIDLIILSGSSQFGALLNKNEFQTEIDLVLNTNIPVIGICLGFELLALAYNSRLEPASEKINDFRIINIINQDPIFKDLHEPFIVKEFHEWCITELGSELKALARSDSGYEIIKHSTKPQYGFQFHPEVFTNQTVGDELFKNAVVEVVTSIKKRTNSPLF